MQPNSIQEACDNRGYDLQQIEAAAAMMPPALQKFIRATAFRAVVVESLNEGEVPDHKNYDQIKYEPIFDLSVPGPAGLGLAFVCTDCWGTFTCCGARLQILNSSNAMFFAENPAFHELHADALTYKKLEADEKN